jgi:hypothetical protein
VVRGLRALPVSALLIACVGASVAAGQQTDSSLDRIRAALSAAAVEPPIAIAAEPPSASWRGISLVQPDIGRKHFIRVRVPVGDYTMKAARALNHARHSRAERRARAQVEQDLQEFLKRRPAK